MAAKNTSILRKDGDDFIFKRGKHEGDTLAEVAKDDPTYLTWVFNEATEGLEDDAFHALEDVMEENDIPFEKD